MRMPAGVICAIWAISVEQMLNPERLRVALIQLSPGPDISENLAKAATYLQAAAERGAELVLLQETFYYRGPHSPQDMQRVAETLPDGPVCTWLSDQARKHAFWLLGGSIFETNPDDLTRAFNTSLCFNPQGERVGRYRKIHLFELYDREALSEATYQTPGDPEQIVTVPTPWGGLGLSICYDLRFPLHYQEQVRTQGARLLAVPSAFLFRTGAAHWETLLRARAIETQCFVLAPNCWSESAPATYGHSLIVDPWGQVLASAADGEGLIWAELDLAAQERIRERLPVLKSCSN